MSSPTSSAEPDRLAAFGTTVAASDEGVSLAVARWAADAGAFFAGAGAFAPPGSGDEWVAPVRAVQAESSYLATWVTSVGEAFRTAGADADGDGVYGAADDVLSPMVGCPVRREQRAYLTALLSTLYERSAAGELDLSPGQSARVLAMARDLVDGAPDPPTEAELLIAAVGPRDLVAAVRLLESGAHDASTVDHPLATGLFDLGHVVSLGLERQPGRAERWVDEILDRPFVFGGAPDELVDGIAVMGAGNAGGTSVFGAALVGGLAVDARPTPTFGLLHRLCGTTDPLAPIMITAAARRPDGSFDQAPLAHGIVRRVVDADNGSSLVRAFGGQGAPPHYDAVRRDVLVAAVDPSLPDVPRTQLSHDLTSRYLDASESAASSAIPVRLWSPVVTEGFAAATQPLVEHWEGPRPGRVIVATDGGAPLYLDGRVLVAAVRSLGEDPAGTDGLATAIGGATTARLADSYRATAVRAEAGLPTEFPPFGAEGLDDLGAVYRLVATEVGNARFQALVAAVGHDGGGLHTAARSMAYGVAGELPGGSMAAGLAEALTVLTAGGHDATSGGSTLAGLEANLTRDLVAFNLVAQPDLATDQLVAALRRAGESDDAWALHRLMHDDATVTDANGGAALAELHRLVDVQEEKIGLDVALAVDEVTQVGGD